MTEHNLFNEGCASSDNSTEEPYVPKRFARKDAPLPAFFSSDEEGIAVSDSTYAQQGMAADSSMRAQRFDHINQEDIVQDDHIFAPRSSSLPEFLQTNATSKDDDVWANPERPAHTRSHQPIKGVVTDEQLRSQMQAEQRAALSSLQAPQHHAEEVQNPLYKRAANSSYHLEGNTHAFQADSSASFNTQATAYMPRYHERSEYFDGRGPEDYMPDDRPVLRTIKPTPEEKPSKLRGCFSTLVTVAVVLILSFLVRSYVITPYEIPTGSMISTINVGDRVFAERISSYLHTMPARGDIITFPSPEDPKVILIKRCIAIEGDTINITEDGKLLINDVVQDEPYVHGQDTIAPTSVEGKYPTYPYTLKKGQVWVMGDNRSNSMDSRYFGPIDASKITGHAFVCYWPFDHFSLLTPVDEIIHVSDPNELK